MRGRIASGRKERRAAGIHAVRVRPDAFDADMCRGVAQRRVHETCARRIVQRSGNGYERDDLAPDLCVGIPKIGRERATNVADCVRRGSNSAGGARREDPAPDRRAKYSCLSRPCVNRRPRRSLGAQTVCGREDYSFAPESLLAT